VSLTKNRCVRCDWCGKLSNTDDGYYQRPDGSAGYIHQPERERFPAGDPTQPSVPSDNDICEECAEDRCPACGSEQIVRTTPTVAGPAGWGGRCKACKFIWGMS
jgi:hypothetical protein